MADNIYNVIIKLRRDDEYNYGIVKDFFIPAFGEVCLVDTEQYGLRAKIGDGVHKFSELNFLDAENNVVLEGYYLNGKFYTDSTYTVELEKGSKHIYINKNSQGGVYVYGSGQFHAVSPKATSEEAGIMKLYQNHGQNVDGTMTQKAITDGVNNIKFDIIATQDGGDPDCLVLNLPWEG